MRGRIEEIEKALGLKKRVPKFRPGDTVQAHVKVREGDKERLQVFEGIVISRRGTGVNASFTVRKVVQGEGIERIFQVHSPGLSKLVVKKHGKVRRAKLFYLRGLKGRAGRVEELFGPSAEEAAEPDDEPQPEPEAKAESPSEEVEAAKK